MISPEKPSADSRFFRASSPEVKRRINDESPLFDEAMSKLYEAAWRFHKEKNGEIMKTLDNKKLPKEMFRTILRSGINCKLSSKELDALLPLFENDGEVDGCEFILLFYRLRYDHRSKLLTERVKRQRRAEQTMIATQQKKIERREAQVSISLVDNFTDDDLQSAVKKIIEAAVKYDRLMPGAVQLDAFESEYMPPHVFREQLKLVFSVQLSIPELSAFIKNFNKENDNGENINCAAFLVTFFRAGFKEKTKRLHDVWAKKKAYADEQERKRLEEEKEQDSKNQMKVDFDFSETDKKNAVRKLRISAKLYDKTTPGAMSMKAFEVKEMPPHVFKEQLRRVFNLHVTPKEMGALMAVFDVNGDGVITCEEFSKVFLNMGFEERSKELKNERARQRRAEEERIRKESEQKMKLASKNAMKVNYTYTEDEYETAMEKLLEAAWRYDKSMPGAPPLDAFEGKYMEPHEFKEQMRRSFYMKLNPQELGAIIHYFDQERTGRIHCESFLKQFVKMGVDERQRRLAEYRVYEKEIADRKARIKAKKKKLADDKQAFVGIEQNFSEEDFTTAFAKLTEGAIKYNRQGAGAVGLDAFECESIPPHVFKEQLKMVFNVKVSMRELWALVSYFDQDQTGSINCKQFLNQFLRTGFEERNRIKEGYRKAQQMKRQNDVLKEIRREEEKQRKAWAEVNFDYNEEDFDQMLEKLVFMCYYYDPRQIGPAGLVAFEAESMTPAEFREQMKRTFNIKLSPVELGAMVVYFDTASKKVVNCTAFMNSLVQIRVRCEEFKGKKNESNLMADYIEYLKEQFQQRMMRNPSVDARPWRQADDGPSKTIISSAVPKLDAPPPNTPLEKYRRRLFVCRRTGKLDLACKEIWAPQAADGPNSSMTISRKRRSNKTDSEKMKSDTEDNGEPDENQLMNSFEMSGEMDQEPTEDNENCDIDAKSTFTGQGSVSTVELVFEQVSISERLPVNEKSETPPPITPPNRSRAASRANSAKLTGRAGSAERRKSKKRYESYRAIDFRLGNIPKDVLGMTDLTELWLCNNVITTIPTEIADLKQLRILSLTNNGISSLPPEICLLDNLKRLYLRKNKLTTLPNLMGKLHKLKEIDCSKNAFQIFPEVLTSLSQVELVDLSFNKISTLPTSMKGMRSLTVLNLEGNNFSTAPPVTLKLPWVEIIGCLVDDRGGAREFEIRPDEEQEILHMLRNRANNAVATKTRRSKIRNGALK